MMQFKNKDVKFCWKLCSESNRAERIRGNIVNITPIHSTWSEIPEPAYNRLDQLDGSYSKLEDYDAKDKSWCTALSYLQWVSKYGVFRSHTASGSLSSTYVLVISCTLNTIFPLALLALYPVDMSQINCISAQTIPGQFGNDKFNPDVGGAAVALSSKADV